MQYSKENEECSHVIAIIQKIKGKEKMKEIADGFVKIKNGKKLFFK